MKATSPASQAPSTPKSQGARTVPQSPHGPGGVTVIVETRPPPSGPRYIHKNPAYLVPRHINADKLLWTLNQHPDLAFPATRLKRTKRGLNLITTATQAASVRLRWPVLYEDSYITIQPFTPHETAQHKKFVLGPISGNIDPHSIRDANIVSAKVMGRKAHINAGMAPYKLLVTYKDASRPTSIVGPGGPIPTQELRAPTTRCTNCQALDHPRNACKADSVCTWCAGAHKSDLCYQKRKQGQYIKVRCCNCQKDGHAASSRTCPKWLAALGRKPNAQVLVPSNSHFINNQWPHAIRPLMIDFVSIQRHQQNASSSGARNHPAQPAEQASVATHVEPSAAQTANADHARQSAEQTATHQAQSAKQTSAAIPDFWNPPRSSGPLPPPREDFLTHAFYACQRILSDYRHHSDGSVTRRHLVQLNRDIAFHSVR